MHADFAIETAGFIGFNRILTGRVSRYDLWYDIYLTCRLANIMRNG